MTSPTIEFSVRLSLPGATPGALAEVRKLLAGQLEVQFDEGWMTLDKALAGWLLQALPNEIQTATATIATYDAPGETPADDLGKPSGGGAVPNWPSSSVRPASATPSLATAPSSAPGKKPRKPRRPTAKP